MADIKGDGFMVGGHWIFEAWGFSVSLESSVTWCRSIRRAVDNVVYASI